MEQPYHARLQALMIQFIRENGGEFGRLLSEEHDEYEGMRVNEAWFVSVDKVAMHMATAAAAAYEAMAAVLDVSDPKMFFEPRVFTSIAHAKDAAQ